MQPIELKDLLSRHDLPIIAASINSKLRDEQAARQRYRDQLTPSEKVEFIGGETMIFPAPDFIAEVLSESTRGRDRGVKFDDSACHAVESYVVTGFRIPVRSLFDAALNLETLQRVCLDVPPS